MTDVSKIIDFDTWLSRSELAARDQAVKSNDRFILAMAKAARSGRENVNPGTFVDDTPPTFAKRYRPEVTISVSGSPAASCLAAAINPVGRRSVK